MKKNIFEFMKTITVNEESLKDIWKSFSIDSGFLTKNELYENYYITDKDTIENLAARFYYDKKYYWIICLINDIKDFFYDFPMTDTELRAYVTKEITENTSETRSESDLYDDLTVVNDAKRDIKLLKTGYLNDFLEQVKIEGEK